MDENKDFTTPENIEENDIKPEETAAVNDDAVSLFNADDFTEKSAEETADKSDDAVSLIGAENFTQTEPTDISTESQQESAPAKKKPVLQTTIIISLVIVIIAALTVLALKLFVNNGVSGTWHLVREVQVMDDGATSDEATHSLDVDYYFEFKDDGTVSSTIGTVTGSGTYELSKDESGNNIVTMDIYDTLTQYFLSGDYAYEVNGNIFTGKTMKFTSVSNPEKSYDFESSKYVAPEIKREGEFTPNEEICGKWIYSTGEFNLVYEFDKNGNANYVEQAMSINPYTYSPINIDISMSGIYNVKDDTITITYYFLEQSDRDMKFKLEGDTLYINDYPFTREGAATVDQQQEAAPAQ